MTTIKPTGAEPDPRETLAEGEQSQGEPQSSPSTASSAQPSDQTAGSPQKSSGGPATKLPAEMTSPELVVEAAVYMGKMAAAYADPEMNKDFQGMKAVLIELGARAALQWAVLAGNKPEGTVADSVAEFTQDTNPGLANFKVTTDQAPRPRRTDVRSK